jgi:hypothetical protein
MIIDSGKEPNDYSQSQKNSLIEKLINKHKLSIIKDYGASVIIENEKKNKKAEIFFDGLEINYEVHYLT